MPDFDLYTGILSELEARQTCHWNRFPPFYILSIGAHLFNIQNKGKGSAILVINGRVFDTRMHLLTCAPPGGEKTFWLEQFLRGEQAILRDTQIDIGWMGTITEAGFVGTVHNNDGEKQSIPGLCQLKPTAIIGAEEMSAITESMKTEYARTLEPAMLSALDSGNITKQLAAGPIEYQTYLTLWGATQPARYDLRGGMGRRFVMIHFVPNSKDWRDITLSMRKGINARFNPPQTDHIRKEVIKLREKISNIQCVTWDEAVFKFFDEMKLISYEELLYDRMLIGYHIMKNKFDKELHLTLDDTIVGLMRKEAYYRDSISRGTEYAEILLLLREHQGTMSIFELQDELMAFGKNWQQSAKTIDELIRMKVVRKDKDNIVLSQKLRDERVAL
jgi:hypothetical protein